MKLYAFIKDLDNLKIDREYDASTIDCIAYVPRRKKTVCYPIYSITVTSTHKNTKVVLNAQYPINNKEPIKLDHLYGQLKALFGELDGHERRGSIFMTIKKSSTAGRTAHTIPHWSSPILDLDQEALFIKATNSFTYKD